MPWKLVPGYPNYEVSDLGFIRSVSRTVTRSDGKVYRYPSKVLKPSKLKNGYLYQNLRRNGARKTNTVLLHRAVMMAFMPVENMDDREVNHIDGFKHNNALENLEWSDRSENIKHNVKLGIHGNQITIERICPRTGEVAIFKSLNTACETIGRTKYSSKVLRKALNQDRMYAGFYWRTA